METRERRRDRGGASASDASSDGELLVGRPTSSPATCPRSTSSTAATSRSYDGELVGIIGPNGAGKSTFLKAVFGLIPVRSGTVTLNGDDITGLKAHTLVARGVGYVPQNNNVFPRLTVEENLQMGLYQRPKELRHALRLRRRPLPAPRPAPEAASRIAVGWRASDGGDGSGADDGALGAAARRALRRACRRRTRTRCSSAATQINKTGVSIIMVEQNARRCLQICHRGFVLDQGTNAYTGTGDELLRDPEGHRALPRHPGQSPT